MTTSVTPQLLEEAGRALFGARWKHDMAAALGVNAKTIRRWSTGDWPVPGRHADNLCRLLDNHGDHIASIKRKLRADE